MDVIVLTENRLIGIRVSQYLDLARETLQELSGGQEVIKSGKSFGDAADDTEIRADREIGLALRKKIASNIILAGRVSVEGLDDLVHPPGKYWFCIDPLDGSLNYKTKGDALGLPYSCCIIVLKKKSKAKFSDIIVAGVIDLRNGDKWIAILEEQGEFKTFFNWKPAATMAVPKLDLGSQILIGEFYYPNNRDLLCKAFTNHKGWLRNPGSAAYEMASVSSGQAVAYICNQQKQHELGAGYALVKGAGGVAVDFDGKDLGEHEFLFNAQTPVILAANQMIADEILEMIKI
jgi:fructose-1,6-bisphosphatase/inositol monophosphatase family enzyme